MASITCTHCSAVLKTKDPIPPGKKVKCPKCSQAFVVPEDDEPAEVPEEIEEVADGDGDFSDLGTPSKKGKPPAKKGEEEGDEAEGDDGEDDKGKKKGKGSDKPKSKTGLIIGIVAAVLLLCCCFPGCGIGITWFTSPQVFDFSGPKKAAVNIEKEKDGKPK